MPWLGTSGRTCSLSGGATWARPKEALYCRSSRWSRGAGTFCGGPGRPLWYEVSSYGPWSSEKHLGARRLTAERSEEHTSELQSRGHLVCRLLLEKKKSNQSDLEVRTT